jgi:uncharacterized protein (TIGR02594 family)
MSDPLWLTRARAFLGLREIPGKGTDTTIAGWLAKLRAPWKDDETPWCGTFVAAVLSETGFKPVDGWAGARKWLNFGVRLPAPGLGCIVVFWRGSPTSWSGHVGFVAGKDKNGNLMVLGGNQGNAVSIKPFGRDRVLGYRWPAGVPTPTMNALPVLTSDGRVSTDEA